ncbi:MAG: site-specific integrase [Streptococcaceae bacterium]|jgi:integrase|nr:site-specific integrase [Streptococcaceae bacterium]MCH4176227.1 site-specific integrase [Streptococcaceae bacterium]
MARKRDKVWQAEVSYKTVDGKFKKWRKGGFRTKKDAELAESEFRLNSMAFLQADYSLSDWFEKWANLYKKDSVTEVTWKKFETVVKNIEKYMPGETLKTITPAKYQELLNNFAECHSKSSVKHLNMQVRSSVQSAITNRIIQFDFTRNAVINGSEKKDVVFLDYSDFKKLRNYTIKSDNEIDLIIYTTLMTGMRIAETLGITAKDIHNDFINVNKTYDYKITGGFAPTKNKSSIRKIYIDSETSNILNNLKKESKKNDNKPIFDIFSINTINKRLKYLSEELSLKKHNLHNHSLRHTHASVLLYKGVSVQSISQRLGHSTVTTTQEIYTHLIKEMKIQEDKKISNALTAK